MAKEELFRSPFIAFFVRGFGAFPVYRGRPDRQAFRQAQEALDKGLALVAFPEGKRSLKASLETAYRGTTAIALHNGTTVLPVAITGTEKLRGLGFLGRPRITVNIGKTFHLPATDKKPGKSDMAALTGCLMGRVAELLPPDYRGVYGAKQ